VNEPRAIATDLVRKLQAAGHEAFWVGGCVRDILLGRTPGDYDIATSATPPQIEELFERTVPVGRKFGVIVVVRDGQEFQIATFRAEADYADGRHPGRVTFGDARADAQRRDFTINGLFYDPLADRLHDWIGGEADLKLKLVRTIGKPAERFAEDHLRLLRTVRFAAQLGFEIEAETLAAVRELAAKIRLISAERVRDELWKLFRAPHAARGLQLLQDCGLLAEVLPEIAATRGCDQTPDFHPEGDVFNHLVSMLSRLPLDAHELLAWAALLHDVAKPVTAARNPVTGRVHFYNHERIGADMSVQILERLRFPRRQIEDIAKAVRYHMQFKDVPLMRKATLRRMLLRPTFPLELELHRLDCLGSHGQLDIYERLVAEARSLAEKPSLKPPLLTGDDLVELGMKPGPEMGAILQELRDRQLQEEVATPDEARAWVKTKLRETAGPKAG
jgi:poly(A) polymerase